MKDTDLLLAIARQETQALETIYERYARSVYSLALRMLHDSALAEEITQEVFLIVWRKPQSYVPARGVFLTWLLGVTHHRCIDELRRRHGGEVPLDRAQPSVFDAGDDGHDPVEEIWLSQEREAVRHALTQLPTPQRLAIELAYFQGMTQMDIASHLGEPLGTIKTRIRLGMQKLRMLLEAQGLRTESL